MLTLLDRHIDEAAMQRRDETPSHYRRGRGRRATQRPTLASVVSGALAAQPAPQPSGRHRSPESASLSASPLGLGHDRDRTITFADVLREPDPDWSQPAAEGVRKEARRDAEQAYKALSPGALNAARHVTRYEVPREWLASVPLLSALDTDRAIAALYDVRLDVQLALARLAAAMSDLYAMPVQIPQIDGAQALAQVFAPVAGLLEPIPFPTDLAAMMLAWNLEAAQDAAEQARVGDVDRRPAVPHVGYDLTAVAA